MTEPDQFLKNLALRARQAPEPTTAAPFGFATRLLARLPVSTTAASRDLAAQTRWQRLSLGALPIAAIFALLGLLIAKSETGSTLSDQDLAIIIVKNQIEP